MSEGSFGEILQRIRESLPWDTIGKKKRSIKPILDEILTNFAKKRVRLVEEAPPTTESTRIGEPKEERPLITFHDGIYKEISAYFKEDLKNERGGFLIGRINNDSVEVTGFVPATSSQHMSPVRFEFVHDDWINLHQIRGDKDVVGWIHSHPNIEPAPSAYDIFITQNFFDRPGMFSMIVDPVNNKLGVFRCKERKSINEGGFILKGNLSKNGLNQIPRVTKFNSLSESH